MSELVFFEVSDNSIEVRIEQETVWLSQEQMAKLFERERSVITNHLRNVFKDGELERGATCAFFAQVQNEGDRTVTRQIEHYNLDAILSVGYRGNAKRGVQFRQWASRVLRDHLVHATLKSPELSAREAA